jgi:hypothetical protein
LYKGITLIGATSVSDQPTTTTEPVTGSKESAPDSDLLFYAKLLERFKPKPFQKPRQLKKHELRLLARAERRAAKRKPYVYADADEQDHKYANSLLPKQVTLIRCKYQLALLDSITGNNVSAYEIPADSRETVPQ